MKKAPYSLKLIKDRNGQGFVEYALIIGFVAICVVVALGAMSGPIAGILASIVEALGIAP